MGRPGRRMTREKYLDKYFEKEMLRAKYSAKFGPHEIVLVLDGLKGNFNVGKIFRSAEAFGARELLLINIPFFDFVPAKGCHRRIKWQMFSSAAECMNYLLAQGYTLYALDPFAETSLQKVSFPKKSALILGHEEYGLSEELKNTVTLNRIKIDQYGQVDSLNVAVAASVALYEYVKQHGGTPVIPQKRDRHSPEIAEPTN